MDSTRYFRHQLANCWNNVQLSVAALAVVEPHEAEEWLNAIERAADSCIDALDQYIGASDHDSSR